MKTRFLAVAVIGVLLLGACASAPPARKEGRVAEIVTMINDGSVKDLVAQSHVPFVFDAELLSRRADVELMWSGLRDAGFEVYEDGYVLEPAGPSDFRRIADTFDMESFFSPGGYLPEDAGWVVAESSVGDLLILLGGREGNLPLIFGITRVR